MGMHRDLARAFECLCASGKSFDDVVGVLRQHQDSAVPVLVDLLDHPDPAWRRSAATALARMRVPPPRSLPRLVKLLSSSDASVKIAAIAAMDWLPPRSRRKASVAVAKLLQSRPSVHPAFTQVRANLPRAVAAHFLGLHGGLFGIEALAAASMWRGDPILQHIEASLKKAKRKHVQAGKARRRTRG
jgi:hypothetical protein